MTRTEATESPAAALAAAVRQAAIEIGAPEGFDPRIERPADPKHGDYASNAALVLAGTLGRSPRELAEDIAGRIDPSLAPVDRVEVAGPGFLNFRLNDSVLWRGLIWLLEEGDAWGRSQAERASRVNVEFVSANPTGPLHVAHGRGAAIGDVTARLLEWTGHDVCREYYVNDAGRQIELLGESVEARLLESRGDAVELPEGGYQGDYVIDLAARIAADHDAEILLRMERGERRRFLAASAAGILREEQACDLADFGVRMDLFFEESELHRTGAVEEMLSRLETSGHAYHEDGALWLRTSGFGDEKDRVLVKSDGSHTYFVSDIAYHLDKLQRGFDRAIDVWGADHQGHVPRMRAALESLGEDPEFLEVLLIQLVSVTRGGAEVRMSKRAGRFVTLRELFEETGPDVARYFFLMRRAEVPMSFDLDLALDTSEANPVFKIQYAHARMCSVFERGSVDPAAISAAESDLAQLDGAAERDVAKTVLRFIEVVRAAAEARAPYQVCGYLEELAGAVNSWYHEGNLNAERRVLAEGPTRPGRLALARAVQLTLRAGLTLLGLTAPERMMREEPS